MSPPVDSDDQGQPDADAMQSIAPMPIRMEWFLALALPWLALAVALGRLSDIPYVTLLAVAGFGSCFFLSLYQIVDSVDEQWAPMGLAIVLTLLFGPIFVALVFLIAWFITWRDDFWTVLGILVTHSLTALVIAYSVTLELSLAFSKAGWTSSGTLIGLTILASAAGWAVANFWRPLNE